MYRHWQTNNKSSKLCMYMSEHRMYMFTDCQMCTYCHKHVHTMSVHGIDMYITHYVHTMSVRVFHDDMFHQQIGVKLLWLIFFTPNYWLLLVIIGYYCYYWVAKSITIIGYYWTTPKTLIIGINRNLLLQLIFLGTNYCN